MKFRELRNSRNGKRNSFFLPSQKFLSCKLVSHTTKRVFCHLDTETKGFPAPLKVFSTSSSIKQYQFFLSINSPWDTGRLLCKSELVCSNKIRSHKKPFAAYITNYIRRVKKQRAILVFTGDTTDSTSW